LKYFKFKLQRITLSTLQENAYLKCIDPKCGLEYSIKSGTLECEKGHLLDAKYRKVPSRALKELFYSRRNPQGSIFNESGVWRFRELLNFLIPGLIGWPFKLEILEMSCRCWLPKLSFSTSFQVEKCDIFLLRITIYYKLVLAKIKLLFKRLFEKW